MRSCSCPALRLAFVPPLSMQQLPQHPHHGLFHLLPGTVQAHPRERLSQHPPPWALFNLRPPFPWPPPPADQVAEGAGPLLLPPTPRPPRLLHVADQLRHAPRPPPADRPGPPPYRLRRIPPRWWRLRALVCRPWLRAGACRTQRPLCFPCFLLLQPAPLPPRLPSRPSLLSGPLPGRRPPLHIRGGGVPFQVRED